MRPTPLNALAKLLGLSSKEQALVHGAAIDSRKVRLGDLFFALPGNRVDGHLFLKQAKEQGAVAAVVKDDFYGESCGLPLLKVPDVLAALQELARRKLQTMKSTVVAITGSLGKTTTKEFAAALIRTKYRVFASPLSYNSQATVPLSILMADGTEEILLLEMGMTHPGQIANLVSIAPPDIALVTTVALQHANNFADGLIGISKEKGSIFSHPKTKLGFLHRDVLHFESMRQIGSSQKQSFSLHDRSADFFLEIKEGEARIYGKEGPIDIPVSFSLKAYYQNFLASVCLARALDVPWPFIQEAAPFLKLPTMRFEKIEKKGIVFINDAYNANPDAMKAALESLPSPKAGGKRIAILSEMDALGEFSDRGHREVAESAREYVDLLFCIGSRCAAMKEVFEACKKPVFLFENKEKLLEHLREAINPGDVVLLKGARSYSLETLLDNFN